MLAQIIDLFQQPSFLKILVWSLIGIASLCVVACVVAVRIVWDCNYHEMKRNEEALSQLEAEPQK